jgi:tetratricopeptide (TPR) repeat protein
MTRTALGSSHTTSESVCSILSSCPLSALRSFLLDSAAPEDSSEVSLPFEAEPPILSAEDEVELQAQPLSPISLVQQAEYLYRQQHHEEAYRLARQAYSIDPYDWRGNLIYVATMVDLGLKNELFYLGESRGVPRLSLSHHRSALPSGHELVHTHPKLAISWYTVACYYWTTKKYESAQKYLMKATKIDKRSVSLSVSLSLSLSLSLSVSLSVSLS